MEKTQGKFSKKDFQMMYDNVSMPVFESWIKDIMDEVGWVKGKRQVFSPQNTRKILAHLGDPIAVSQLNN